MRAIAVIGSCWGDEGKGSAVDKLASTCILLLIFDHNAKHMNPDWDWDE